MESPKPSEVHHCTVCNKFFSTKASLKRHSDNGHPALKSCQDCTSVFFTDTSLKLHRKSVHCNDRLNFKCSECPLSFASRSIILKHFSECHSDISVKEEQLTFTSMNEFFEWKQNIERQSVAHFVNNVGSRVLKSGVIHYYD